MMRRVKMRDEADGAPRDDEADDEEGEDEG